MKVENKEIMRRFYDEVFNMKNLDLLEEFMIPNFVDNNPGPRQKPGREGIRQLYHMFFAAYPDLHFAIDFQVAEGDLVVSRLTATGTHLGEFSGVQATGTKVKTTGIDIVRIVEGKQVERWGNWRMLILERGFMTDLAYSVLGQFKILPLGPF